MLGWDFPNLTVCPPSPTRTMAKQASNVNFPLEAEDQLNLWSITNDGSLPHHPLKF
jgi:hypothetical protein